MVWLPSFPFWKLLMHEMASLLWALATLAKAVFISVMQAC